MKKISILAILALSSVASFAVYTADESLTQSASSNTQQISLEAKTIESLNVADEFKEENQNFFKASKTTLELGDVDFTTTGKFVALAEGTQGDKTVVGQFHFNYMSKGFTIQNNQTFELVELFYQKGVKKVSHGLYVNPVALVQEKQVVTPNFTDLTAQVVTTFKRLDGTTVDEVKTGKLTETSKMLSYRGDVWVKEGEYDKKSGFSKQKRWIVRQHKVYGETMVYAYDGQTFTDSKDSSYICENTAYDGDLREGGYSVVGNLNAYVSYTRLNKDKLEKNITGGLNGSFEFSKLKDVL